MTSQGSRWRHPEELYALVCRPALPQDTSDVMELTRTIWEGEDYVPGAWLGWLQDANGLLAVAQYGPRVVGLGKLSCLAAGEWWMQGLRVDPAYEGRGIASRLHDYILRYWVENGEGVLRLSTASFRASVQHLCYRTGFQKVAEFTPFGAAALLAEGSSFLYVPPEEAAQVFTAVAENEIVLRSRRLMDWGWQWVSLSPERLSEAAQTGRLWRWRGGETTATGELVARGDEDENALAAELLACQRENLVELLLDFRRLAGALGYSKAAWFAPLGAGLEANLESAGYEREWEASVYVYEKQHPIHPAPLVV